MKFGILGVLVAILILAGCAGQSPAGESTVRVESVKKSGFLEDYSILRIGWRGRGQPRLLEPDGKLCRL